ncbi:cation diffusion facilitator family transporter [Bowmanella pacifica]|uniref:Cation efflux protein transmembrane domain-containing protein n=1 Tax=Bowmanella pacifica TaxID=502051 RepID=A0A918DJB7_9ALTE|nr:cation diffusion facilitator family transporter [Bowmanella pacifica]GGO70116.1 hypothetical protein GCM10010982_22860 [Bowmanella pacifica]
MAGCCAPNAEDLQQRKLLWVVLTLNALMFVVEFVAGWLAHSSGLMADSLDMLADAMVYGASLYAVGRAISTKANVAMLSGSLQLFLGGLVLLDVIKNIWLGVTPDIQTMYAVALMALVVNVLCFALLYQHRHGDINLRASWVCSRNDMLANLGVLLSAALVSWLGAAWPDWVIGSVIALIIIFSAWRIIRDARQVATDNKPSTNCCY